MASTLLDLNTRITSKSLKLISSSEDYFRELPNVSVIAISLEKIAIQCLAINDILSQIDSDRKDSLEVVEKIGRDIERVVDEALLLTGKLKGKPTLNEQDGKLDTVDQQALDSIARLLTQLKEALASHMWIQQTEEPVSQTNEKPPRSSSNSSTLTQDASSLSTNFSSLNTSQETIESHDFGPIDLKEFPWLANQEPFPRPQPQIVIRDSMLSFNDDDVDTLRLSRGISFFSDIDDFSESFLREVKRSNLSALQRARNIFKITGSRRISEPVIYEPVIGEPEDPLHVHHVGVDERTGEYTGLPKEWKEIINGQSTSASLGLTVSTSQGFDSKPESNSTKHHYPATIKLVAVGDQARLKTRLLTTYSRNGYPQDQILPVFDNYAVTITIGDDTYIFGLFDTAGQESYDRLRPLSYPQTDVFIICANLKVKRQFENALKDWWPELKHHCPGVPVLLVGVSDDEDSDDEGSKGIERIERDFAEGIAKKMGVKYVECDLPTMKGVKNVFDEAIIAALEPPVLKPKKRVWRRNTVNPLAQISEN